MGFLRRNWWVVLAVVVAGAVLVYFFGFSNRPAVRTAMPVRGPAVEAVYATGSVEPVHWAKVAPVVTGRLIALNARDNQAVTAGETLARLDDREARARLAELQAKVAYLSRELQRVYSLHERKIISEQAYQRTISDHAAAVAAVAAQQQRLKDYTLVSPLEGTVLRQDGNIGEVIRAGEVIFWVGKPTPLRVEAEVDEEDIVLVKKGQEVLVKADAFPRQSFRATVAAVTPKGDPVNKVYRVRIRLNPGTPLKIGMTTEVNIIVRRKADALLVPTDAVDGSIVWVVQRGRARRRRVVVGVRGDTRTEILRGLKEGEVVVLAPPKDLKHGQRVTAEKADAKEDDE